MHARHALHALLAPLPPAGERAAPLARHARALASPLAAHPALHAHWRIIDPQRLPWRLLPATQETQANTHAHVGQFRSMGRGQIRSFEVHMQAAVAQHPVSTTHPLCLLMVIDGTLRLGNQADDSPLQTAMPYLLDVRALPRADWSRLHAFWMVLPAQRLPAFAALRSGVQALGDASVGNALQAQIRVLTDQRRGWSRHAMECMHASIVELALHAHRERQEQHAPAAGGLLQMAFNYLQAHYHRADLRVDDVALATGCSRSALCRLFASHSLTVAGYLRELRLTRCRQALAHASTRSNIEQTAFRHGFADLHAFSRLFKRRFGITPGQARGARA